MRGGLRQRVGEDRHALSYIGDHRKGGERIVLAPAVFVVSEPEPVVCFQNSKPASNSARFPRPVVAGVSGWVPDEIDRHSITA